MNVLIRGIENRYKVYMKYTLHAEFKNWFQAVNQGTLPSMQKKNLSLFAL